MTDISARVFRGSQSLRWRLSLAFLALLLQQQIAAGATLPPHVVDGDQQAVLTHLSLSGASELPYSYAPDSGSGHAEEDHHVHGGGLDHSSYTRRPAPHDQLVGLQRREDTRPRGWSARKAESVKSSKSVVIPNRNNGDDNAVIVDWDGHNLDVKSGVVDRKSPGIPDTDRKNHGRPQGPVHVIHGYGTHIHHHHRHHHPSGTDDGTGQPLNYVNEDDSAGSHVDDPRLVLLPDTGSDVQQDQLNNNDNTRWVSSHLIRGTKVKDDDDVLLEEDANVYWLHKLLPWVNWSALDNYSLHMENDTVVSIVVVTLLISILLFTLAGRHRALKNSDKGCVIALNGLNSHEGHPYLVKFTTGSRPGAGTSGELSFCLQGSKRDTDVYTVPSSVRKPDRILKGGTTRTFVIDLDGSLGDILMAELKLATGFLPEKWFLCKMTVVDVLGGKTWYFPCHKWITSANHSFTKVFMMEGIETMTALYKDNFWTCWKRYHLWAAAFSYHQAAIMQMLYATTCCGAVYAVMFTHLVLILETDVHKKVWYWQWAWILATSGQVSLGTSLINMLISNISNTCNKKIWKVRDVAEYACKLPSTPRYRYKDEMKLKRVPPGSTLMTSSTSRSHSGARGAGAERSLKAASPTMSRGGQYVHSYRTPSPGTPPRMGQTIVDNILSYWPSQARSGSPPPPVDRVSLLPLHYTSSLQSIATPVRAPPPPRESSDQEADENTNTNAGNDEREVVTSPRPQRLTRPVDHAVVTMPAEHTALDMDEDTTQVKTPHVREHVTFDMSDSETEHLDIETYNTLETVEQFVKKQNKGCLPPWFAYIVLAALLGLTMTLILGSLLLGSTLGTKTAGKWFGLVFFSAIHHAFVFEPFKVAVVAAIPTAFLKKAL